MNRVLASRIVSSIQDVISSGPNSSLSVSLHEPFFDGTAAIENVTDCIRTGWVSSAGTWVKRFEDEICQFTGAEHAIAVVNGTSGLRLALHLVGVVPNSEVIIPPLSFVATANAVAHLGAIPNFSDIHSSTLALDPVALSHYLSDIAVKTDSGTINRRTNRLISAIMPVHVFGFPAPINEIVKVGLEWNIPIVEDAAEALGSWSNNIHCGLCGSVGVISFNGNKIITTGGGGVLITNDCHLAKSARHLSTTAKLSHPWEFYHDSIGWNDRMPNLNAALGVAQLEDLDRRLSAKLLLFQQYQDAFQCLSGVELLHSIPNAIANNWLITLRLTNSSPIEALSLRNEILSLAHHSGILLRPSWSLLNQLPMFSSSPSAPLPVAVNQSHRLINLPSSPQLHPSYTSTF